MSAPPLLGRQSIRIGSANDVEIFLGGANVLPLHAEIIHQGQGRLAFVPSAPGCSVDGRTLETGAVVHFDFQSQFAVAGHAVPLTAKPIVAMVMARGLLPYDPERFVVGRDPERVHLVLTSPGVSGLHATYFPKRQEVVDHKSTSGTWKEGKRIPAEKPVSVTPETILALGPLPLPIAFAAELHSAKTKGTESPLLNKTQAMPEVERPGTAVPAVPAVPSEARARHRTLVGTVRMLATGQKTIGRTPDNDIVLEHPQISGRHARLLSVGGQLLLEDSGSELGTYVRGTRLKPHQHVPVQDGERVLFGPIPAVLRITQDAVDILLEDQANWAGKPLFEVEAQELFVEVTDREDPRRKKVLVDRVSLRAKPGDLIALMGPSGSGKTTLLHLLTGYRSASGGNISINGEPLSQIFDALRGSIGYVPQDDILHPELTVSEAVRYSARLRLPPDYTEEEIEARVATTLRELGLENVAHLTIGRPEAKVLSGGQRKRVNIALEIVTDPPLLFLDEPTSGLSADDTTAIVGLLSNLAKTHGKTIIATIHQPARDEYERFNLVLVLGQGGVPLYFGPTRDAYAFFEAWRPVRERSNIDNPRDMFAELRERESRLRKNSPELTSVEARGALAEAFRKEYDASPIAKRMLRPGGTSAAFAITRGRMPARKRPPGQLRLLISRYLKVKLRDRTGTAILFLQAPIIGFLLALVFAKQQPGIPYFCLGALTELSRKAGEKLDVPGVLSTLEKTQDHSAALFFLVVSAVWFGTSNAAREIVSERALYERERMVNLTLPNYVLSKFLVLAGLCVIQCTVLLSIVFPALGLAGGFAGFLAGLGALILTSFSAVGLGLLLSSVVTSTEAAMALTPIALIPQVVLGGLMVPVTTVPWLKVPMLLIPARWGFEGVARIERLATQSELAWNIPLGGASESLPDFVSGAHFHCGLAQLESVSYLGAWGFSSAGSPWLSTMILGLMTTLLLALVMVRLGRRDLA